MSTPSQAAATSAPITERRFLTPFILITSLFFLWAFGVNLNDILIPRFKTAFALTDFQSSFIQVAFFGGYFLAAFPAGKLMERIGYKRGILFGLGLCAKRRPVVSHEMPFCQKDRCLANVSRWIELWRGCGRILR